MSSSPLARRCALALLIGLSALLGACNWQPLYGESRKSGYSARDYLAQVQVQPLRNRTGQIMHNMLRDRLNPLGQPTSPGYYLFVTMRETREDFILRRDETASRINLRVEGDYQLVAQDGRSVLFRNRAIAFNAYNVLDSEFATQNARDAARREALEQVADTIEAQLAAFFVNASQKRAAALPAPPPPTSGPILLSARP